MKFCASKILFFTLSIFIEFLSPVPILANGRFSQIILDFPQERPFDYFENKEDNSLTLSFKNTIPSELKALNTYDDRVIRRVLIKEITSVGTEVKLVFKDRSIRTIVSKHYEPYRVSIDIFDANYQQNFDPITGLPLDSQLSTSITAAPQNSGKMKFVDQTEVQNINQPANSLEANENNGKRKLLQPTPDEIYSAKQLPTALEAIPEGKGKYWVEYPPYIYPLQTASYQGRTKPNGYDPKQNNKALSDAQLIAEQGLKMYVFGHENKALVAYQQVLHQQPSIFEQDVLHLWAFAEIHLGQGNLTLADGYYHMLIQKHPDSSLSQYAKLRRIDIRAVRYLQTNEYQYISSLLPELDKIVAGKNSELITQIEIRKSYWEQKNIQKNNNLKYIPFPEPTTVNIISDKLSTVEGQRTAFLASCILAKHYIKNETPWQKSSGEFLASFFKKFSGEASEPYYSQLKEELQQRLANDLINLEQNKQYSNVLGIYSTLPKALQSISKFPNVAWALAESYRKSGSIKDSIAFYGTVNEAEENGPKKFRSLLWTTIANQEASLSSSANLAQAFKNTARKTDLAMQNAWINLNEGEKNQISNEHKVELENVVLAKYNINTVNQIVLEQWKSNLATKTAEATNNNTFSPNHAVKLLSKLANKFANSGKQNEKNETLKLLKEINPSNLEGDEIARKLWSKELLTLAEEYRKENNYLEAGRLYTFTANADSKNENRAETLYKGGLLLFRAGKRAEAIEAFTAASEDGNNLFYSNLAKERLSQLQE